MPEIDDRPKTCPQCGAKIVGETFFMERLQTVYHCDNGHMIAGKKVDTYCN